MRYSAPISRGAIVAAVLVFPLGRIGQAGQAPAAPAGQPAARYEVPRTPWGEPDIQGIWTATRWRACRSSARVPGRSRADQGGGRQAPGGATGGLNRAATGSGATGGSSRDIAPAFAKTTPSTQVAMVVDPPDGKMPPLTPEGQKRFAERRRAAVRTTRRTPGPTRAPGIAASRAACRTS